MPTEQGIQFALIFTQIGMGLRVCSARKTMQNHKQWASVSLSDTLQEVTGEA